MKQFSDLIFKAHSMPSHFETFAEYTFGNGYGISVVTGRAAYGSGCSPYEVAVIGKSGDLDYRTGITEDVIGHLDAEGVTKVMQQIQQLH